MKQAIYSLAAILCLVTMLLGSSSCMAMGSHAKAPSTDCPTHAPANQPVPACCAVHHQPSASATVFAVEQPVQVQTIHSFPVILEARAVLPPPPFESSPPPLPPLLKLRI
ncbi:MAG: hypothetical protein BGO25_09150 [Acidobacteriales bacterium 59-55]|nr:hypothetical protein [Terriglobales bacterium]OJV39958.1 MAG: hypothetical protein BGO25_09150 [Acidobacteriales bacterium 59-55]